MDGHLGLDFGLFYTFQTQRSLSGAITAGQSGPENNGKEVVLLILQISKAWAELSDGLISYPGHSLLEGESYPLQKRIRCIL